jgi:ribosome biogenesis GTPase
LGTSQYPLFVGDHVNSWLQKIGCTDAMWELAKQYDSLVIGRIITQHKVLYKVATEANECMAEVSGKFRHNAGSASQFPVVGDFVLMDRDNDEHGNAIIHHVLERKSAFSRKMVGCEFDSQMIAANIDVLFLCMSLNNDFNIRRLERYIAVAWDSGAIPVVVLTKSDLSDNLDGLLEEVQNVAIGLDVVITSSKEEDGLQSIQKYIKSGVTIAFVGSSGVGKSTIINRLLGGESIATQALRNDDKGKHTTTHRELFLLPEGGAVIDTPGMRELGLDFADLSKTFTDIEELALHCKFKDCTHQHEPHCAVRKAIEDGILSEDHLLGYQKLQKEVAYRGLKSRQIEKRKVENMFSGFGGIKNAKKFIKSKNKDW